MYTHTQILWKYFARIFVIIYDKNERYDIITDEEWYNFDDHDFGDAHSGWELVRLTRLNVCARVFKGKSERA